MNAKQETQAKQLIEWALGRKSPVFETLDVVVGVFGSSGWNNTRHPHYRETLALLQYLEKEGTVNSLLTTMNGRVWWLVERIVSVESQPVNILNALWDSTDDLHRRFGKYPPVEVETIRVFVEESREFIDEVTFVHTAAGSTDNLCQEAADVLVTMLATISALGIPREKFIESALAVAAKNNAKTDETHVVNPTTGKIQRRAVKS